MNTRPTRQTDLAELTAQWADSRRLAHCREVTGIATDSRQVNPGNVFVAIKGYQHDGHQFITEAIERGAVAVAYQDPDFAGLIPSDVSAIAVDDSRRAAAYLAADFWEHPSRFLKLVGITGTNGKTTVAYMIDSIFRAGGATTGLITTLARVVDDRNVPAARTTPGAVELQGLLAQMLQEGIGYVSMEVSSHGLYLDRTWLCKFNALIFTNLTQDHLDFHAAWDEYFAAKLRLFTDYPRMAAPEKSPIAAVNIDDPAGQRIKQEAKCRVITYGLGEPAMVTATDAEIGSSGISFRLHLPEGVELPITLGLTGNFNLYNALAAAACAWGMGIGPEQIATGLADMKSVPGRFECIDEGQDFTVIVDYAHTPDALDNVLSVARDLGPSRLLCVFGCGGDRDHTKRPMMGEIAAAKADFAIITSDNPRHEEPMNIIDQITSGATGENYAIQADRRKAIYEAISRCSAGDILIIAGKGHETYQEFADCRVPFDDREVARQALREMLA